MLNIILEARILFSPPPEDRKLTSARFQRLGNELNLNSLKGEMLKISTMFFDMCEETSFSFIYWYKTHFICKKETS